MSFLGVATDPDAVGAGDRTITSNITIGGPLTGSLNFGAAADTDAVNYSGTLTAASTGATISVFGDFSGLLSTDVVTVNNAWTAGEGALGGINVTGDGEKTSAADAGNPPQQLEYHPGTRLSFQESTTPKVAATAWCGSSAPVLP